MEFGLLQVFELKNLLMMWAGILIGLFTGATPGLTISLGMIVVLPLTFGLSPLPALSMLIGLYQAGMSGGAISAILLNIPGTPAAAATALDGHALACRGQPESAILTACTSSFLGGLIGLFFLVLVAPLLAQVALKFGPVEQFSLILVGMTLIAGLSQGAMLKGSVSAVLGFMLATIGMDPMVATPRLTFGSMELMRGVSWLPIMIGGFAIPEVLKGMKGTASKAARRIRGLQIFRPIGLINLRRIYRSILLGGLVGTGVGFLPGANAPVAVFLAYEIARRRSKNPQEFGKGSAEGIAAPEAANNAVAGGAMIPLLTLGIPGDTVTAILLSAFTIQGFSPGPLFFFQQTDLIYAIFLIILVVSVLNFFTICTLSSLLAWVVHIPKGIIMPIIAVFCVVGTLLIRNSFMDVYLMVGAGLMAYLMARFGFPFIPLILAMILGPQLETNFRLSLILSGGNPLVFLTSPVSAAILVFGFLLLFRTIRSGVGTKVGLKH
ncbi:MAG: tripartite tricarboxylate transporter permease [Deltaproteobacteria bacterium]|nr:tripartite tricarboxylate transporter permease [Deltaproteobacteria bacterium]